MIRQFICVATALAIACGAFPSAAASREASSGDGKVVLGHGQAGTMDWKVLAYRSRGQGGNRRPCIEVGMRPRSPATDITDLAFGSISCGALEPTPSVLALVNELSQPKVTVLAMVFPIQVHSVRLFLGFRKERVVPLTVLSQYKGAKASIDQFHYASLAFTGRFCLQRFVTYAKDGRLLDGGERMHCPIMTMQQAGDRSQG